MIKRVVVTGLGALSPIGNNVATFWDSIVHGKSGAAPITKFDTEKFKTSFACELKGFDPTLTERGVLPNLESTIFCCF